MSSENIKKVQTLDSHSLANIAFGINGAGGGGNVKELYNPDRDGGILGLVEELGKVKIPFYSIEMLAPNDSVCCVARLGSPGAKADQYAVEASQAIVEGLQVLSEATGQNFPKAIFPVEATAGQMVRATRAALAATKSTGKPVAILDGDVCGGMAVPAVPLAFSIYNSLGKHPQVALVQLKRDGSNIKPYVELISEDDPTNLETILREIAGNSEMGAVWFAWLMTDASSFKNFFTPKAVSSSIRRGKIVRNAVQKGSDPAQDLLRKREIEMIVTQGKVASVTNESEIAPGFAQFSYKLDTPLGQLCLAARNEYIVLYDADRSVLVRAPEIISVLGKKGPIQSHVLQPEEQITIVTATPQALINRPEMEPAWLTTWESYWQEEKSKGTWPHPY